MERGAWGLFHKLFCALCPTFEKLFRGVVRALRRAPNFIRAISMICVVRPTFMKLTPGSMLSMVLQVTKLQLQQ